MEKIKYLLLTLVLSLGCSQSERNDRVHAETDVSSIVDHWHGVLEYHSNPRYELSNNEDLFTSQVLFTKTTEGLILKNYRGDHNGFGPNEIKFNKETKFDSEYEIGYYKYYFSYFPPDTILISSSTGLNVVLMPHSAKAINNDLQKLKRSFENRAFVFENTFNSGREVTLNEFSQMIVEDQYGSKAIGQWELFEQEGYVYLSLGHPINELFYNFSVDSMTFECLSNSSPVVNEIVNCRFKN